MAKKRAKGWRNNRSDVPDEPGAGNPDHPDADSSKPKSKRKPKQRELPTMERERHPKLEKLADIYCEQRDSRMSALEREIDARNILMAAMREHGLKSYDYDGKLIEIIADEKIKVKAKKSESDDEEEGESEE